MGYSLLMDYAANIGFATLIIVFLIHILLVYGLLKDKLWCLILYPILLFGLFVFNSVLIEHIAHDYRY